MFRRLNMALMSILDLHIHYNPDLNLSKIFCRCRQLSLKFSCKDKGTRITKTILKNNNNIGELISPDFKTSYKATIIMMV